MLAMSYELTVAVGVFAVVFLGLTFLIVLAVRSVPNKLLLLGFTSADIESGTALGLVKHIREITTGHPIMVMLSSSDHAQFNEFRAAGASHCISKPVPGAILLEAVSKPPLEPNFCVAAPPGRASLQKNVYPPLAGSHTHGMLRFFDQPVP